MSIALYTLLMFGAIDMTRLLAELTGQHRHRSRAPDPPPLHARRR